MTAKADGTKLKPFIVFKERGAKRDIEAMQKDKEFRGKFVLATSSNAWMTAETTEQYVNAVIGGLAFKRRLLAWDTYACHLTPEIKKSLAEKKIDIAYVPGGCTGYIQAPDVCWNKPFKHYCTERYDEWLATDSLANLKESVEIYVHHQGEMLSDGS